MSLDLHRDSIVIAKSKCYQRSTSKRKCYLNGNVLCKWLKRTKFEGQTKLSTARLVGWKTTNTAEAPRVCMLKLAIVSFAKLMSR